MQTKELKTGTLHRSFLMDRAAIDEKNRTVPLSFSSEEPYQRWFGTEILDHSPGSVRLDRMKQTGPLLVDHDMREHVGVVEEISIDTDRTGRAVVRFGRSARAQEIYQDVIDGIRCNISVGYIIHRMVLEDPAADEEVYRAMDWEPLEISIVSVPADVTVGIGRSVDGDHMTVIEKTETEPESNDAPAPKLQEIKIMSEEKNIETPAVDPMDAVKSEQKRTADLLELAEAHGFQADVRNYISSGKTADQFMRHILDQKKAELTNTPNPAELDLTPTEVKTYSLMRAIKAASTGDWSKAGFERECSIAIQDQLGRDAKGFFVPFNVQKRELTAGTSTTGAEMVGTDHLAGSFIDALIEQSVIGQLGATFLPGLVGDVDIPAMGAATFSWIAEGADAALSTPATSSVALSPKTVAGAVELSRRFVKQSAPAAEMVVERILRAGAAEAIDAAVIAGSGVAGQPTGILSTTGVNTQAVAAAGSPTWAELVGFETAVAVDKALRGKLAYLTTPGVRGTCKTTAKDAGSGLFLWEKNEINGYPAVATTNVSANGIIFGNFEDIYIGMWGVLDLMVDAYTNAASGGLVLRAFQDVDCGIGHAVSFCKNA